MSDPQIEDLGDNDSWFSTEDVAPQMLMGKPTVWGDGPGYKSIEEALRMTDKQYCKCTQHEEPDPSCEVCKALNPEKPIAIACGYIWLIPHIREIGRECGYAIATHGSMNRDLDLVAIPWIEKAKPAEELVDQIVNWIDTGGGGAATREDDPVAKPHGRRCWTIILPGHGFFIDLSVMPRDEFVID